MAFKMSNNFNICFYEAYHTIIYYVKTDLMINEIQP